MKDQTSAPTGVFASADLCDPMHAAICQAVALLNRSTVASECHYSRQAHEILRLSLGDYADSLMNQRSPNTSGEPRLDVDSIQDVGSFPNEKKMSANPAVAAIKYAIEHPCDSPVEFLRAWFYGDFDAIRREWAGVPEDVYVGSDPLHPMTVTPNSHTERLGQ